MSPTSSADFVGLSPDALALPNLPLTEDGLYLKAGHGRGRADRIKHGFQLNFEDPLIVVPPRTGEFRVAVMVHADNLPDPQEAELRIVVRPQAELRIVVPPLAQRAEKDDADGEPNS